MADDVKQNDIQQRALANVVRGVLDRQQLDIDVAVHASTAYQLSFEIQGQVLRDADLQNIASVLGAEISGSSAGLRASADLYATDGGLETRLLQYENEIPQLARGAA